MDEIEASVTRSWASIFINASDKEELLYEDLISIYHTMYNLALPAEPVGNVTEFFAKKLKEKIDLADCTLKDSDFQVKILVYLSCQADCPTKDSTVTKITNMSRDEQVFIFELIQDIEGLIEAHASRQQQQQLEATESKPRLSLCDMPGKPAEKSIIQTLEESFSNSPNPNEGQWKANYTQLRYQHIQSEAEIQELQEQLNTCFAEIASCKTENKALQSAVKEKEAVKLQLGDCRAAYSEAAAKLDSAEKNVVKLKDKVKDVALLESCLNDKDQELSQLKADLETADKINTQNMTARKEQRIESQKNTRLEVENKSLQTCITQLRAEIESMRQSRRQSLCPQQVRTGDMSFEALVSLADELQTAEEVPTNEEMEALKTENCDLKIKVENLRISEEVMKEQITSQVEEITQSTLKLEEVKTSLDRKTEQLQSLKNMFQKLKHDSEAKYDKAFHEHRYQLDRVKSDLNDALFLSKKEIMDKDFTIEKLKRKLERAEHQRTAAPRRDTYASPDPCTPVIIRKYRTPRTPSNIPRLLTPKKRNFSKYVDEARIDEMSKRNQAVPPHLRSTYPVEVQYHDKAMDMDSTGRINSSRFNKYNATCSLAKPSTATCSLAKPSTAFEIPNSPKTKPSNKREELVNTQSVKRAKENHPPSGFLMEFSPPKPKKSEELESTQAVSKSKENNPNQSVLLQFSPPKPNYRRKKVNR